jgi:uncharacterized membrane protein
MLFFQRGMGLGMMGGYQIGWLVMVFFVVVVAAGIIALIVGGTHASGHFEQSVPAPPGTAGHEEAVAIAKRRFASGEITSEQYEEIIRTLGG